MTDAKKTAKKKAAEKKAPKKAAPKKAAPKKAAPKKASPLAAAAKKAEAPAPAKKVEAIASYVVTKTCLWPTKHGTVKFQEGQILKAADYRAKKWEALVEAIAANIAPE